MHLIEFPQKIFRKLPFEIRSFLHLSGTSASTQIIRLFTGIINAGLLTPSLYATNAMVNIIVRYITFSQLGSQNGLNRQLPIEYGKKNESMINNYLYSTFWFLFFLAGLIIIFLMGLYFFNIEISNVVPKEFYFDICLLSIGTLFSGYFISFLIITKQYKSLSVQRLLFDALGAIISVFFVYYYKLHGLLLLLAGMQFLSIAYIIHKIKFKVQFVFSLKHLFSLSKVGIFILLSSLLYYFFTTLDILFVSSLFTKEKVGWYGFALTCAGFFRVYATSISDILSPKIGNTFGSNNEDSASLVLYATDYIYVIIFAFGVFVAVFYFIIPLIIRFFLPAYFESIGVFQILILAAYALTIFIPSGHIITVLKKQTFFMIALSIISAFVYLIFSTFITKNSTLEEISFIILVASFLFSSIIIYYSISLTCGKLDVNKRYILYLLIFIGICLFFFLLGIMNVDPSNKKTFISLELVKLILTEFGLIYMFFKLDTKNPIVCKIKKLINGIKKEVFV